MTSNFTLSVYSENSPGVLHRITVLFTRRKLNIESLTVSETETHGVSRFTIVVQTEGDTVAKVSRQIRRIIDVHEVVVSRDEDLIVSEIAMYKVGAKGADIRDVIDRNSLKLSYENGS